MNFIKSLLAASLLLIGVTVQAQTTGSTNLLAVGAHLITTQRIQLLSIQGVATNTITVDLYDNDSLADPYFGTNYVNAAYTSYLGYATNVVTPIISINGPTNYSTNSGWHTYSATTAAGTNVLNRMLSFTVPPNGSVSLSPSIVFGKGLVVRVSGVGTLAALNYTYNTQ